MRSKLTLLFAAAAVVVALVAATNATAASFEIRPAGNITSNSLGKLTFEEGSGIVNVQCNVTMSGSLHTGVIEKTAGALLGFIQTGRVLEETCSGGSARIAEASFPWHISYESITGTLPSAVTAVGILLRNTRFLIAATTIFGTPRCMYRGNAEGSLAATGRNPYTSGLIRANENTAIPLEEQALNSSISCPGSGFLKGTLSLTTQTVTRS